MLNEKFTHEIGIKVNGALPTAAFISGESGSITAGYGVRLTGSLKVKFVRSGGSLEIGDNVELRGNITIGDGSKVVIGSGSRINRHSTLIALEGANILIGKDCLFSNVMLRTCDMHSVLNADGARLNYSRDIHVGDRVWLAENTYISKGVSVGSGSVVAANSVLVKSTPENVVVGGNPAFVIKTGISWSRKRQPLEAKGVIPFSNSVAPSSGFKELVSKLLQLLLKR